MEAISYSVALQVIGGPQIRIAGKADVHGYEMFDVTVPAKTNGTAGTLKLVVAPGALDQVQVLLIVPNVTDKSVAFKTSATGAAAIPLDGPLTLIGAAATSLLGAPPDTIVLTNSGDAAASVQIFVGRNAVAA